MKMTRTYKPTIRRDKVEILFTMLESIADGYNKPTIVMYACGLSWKPLRRMIDNALNKGWIGLVPERIKDKRTNEQFFVTPSGFRLIRLLEQIILEVY